MSKAESKPIANAPETKPEPLPDPVFRTKLKPAEQMEFRGVLNAEIVNSESVFTCLRMACIESHGRELEHIFAPKQAIEKLRELVG